MRNHEPTASEVEVMQHGRIISSACPAGVETNRLIDSPVILPISGLSRPVGSFLRPDPMNI
jgi:hypothetical protein